MKLKAIVSFFSASLKPAPIASFSAALCGIGSWHAALVREVKEVEHSDDFWDKKEHSNGSHQVAIFEVESVLLKFMRAFQDLYRKSSTLESVLPIVCEQTICLWRTKTGAEGFTGS